MDPSSRIHWKQRLRLPLKQSRPCPDVMSTFLWRSLQTLMKNWRRVQMYFVLSYLSEMLLLINWRTWLGVAVIIFFLSPSLPQKHKDEGRQRKRAARWSWNLGAIVTNRRQWIIWRRRNASLQLCSMRAVLLACAGTSARSRRVKRALQPR